MVLASKISYEEIENAMKTNHVSGFIQIGSDPEAMKFSKEFCSKNHSFECYYSVGFHPSDAGKVDPGIGVTFAHENNHDPAFRAIGEVGLDYHYGKNTKEKQLEIFENFVRCAISLEKPLIVHTRDAHDDTFSILQRASEKIKILIHCFTGGPKEIKDYLDIGCYISFSGIVTFNKAEEIKQAAQVCPLNKLLVESDAPYLSPVPFRGKTNHPGLISHTAKHIASLKDVDYELFCSQVAENTRSFFNI